MYTERDLALGELSGLGDLSNYIPALILEGKRNKIRGMMITFQGLTLSLILTYTRRAKCVEYNLVN